jgi:hypothetical protein
VDGVALPRRDIHSPTIDAITFWTCKRELEKLRMWNRKMWATERMRRTTVIIIGIGREQSSRLVPNSYSPSF